MSEGESRSQQPPAAEAPKKRRTLTNILLVLAAAVILFVVVVAMQPADFRVVRSATIAAPPQAVFVQVNDFHNWDGWSPWNKLDPNMKTTYEGPPAGIGAKYFWAGDSNVGEGSMTITESKPDELVRIDLQFIRPFAGSNTSEFTFQPQGEQTTVTWSMDGKLNFVTKGMNLFMSMEKMIGDQFEQGLAQMKSVVEKG
jgi:hypothetical protein